MPKGLQGFQKGNMWGSKTKGMPHKPHVGFQKGHKINVGISRKMSEEGKQKISEENSHLWKGDNVKYRALHCWVERQLGKPGVCEDCGKISSKQHTMHWANINGLYKRIISDWRRLCVKCHKKFDMLNPVSLKKRKYIVS